MAKTKILTTASKNKLSAWEQYESAKRAFESQVMLRHHKNLPRKVIEILPEWVSLPGDGVLNAQIRITYQDQHCLINEFNAPKGFFMAPHHHVPDGYQVEAIFLSFGCVEYRIVEEGSSTSLIRVNRGQCVAIQAMVSHGFLTVENSHGYVLFVKLQNPFKRLFYKIKNYFKGNKESYPFKINT